MDTSALEDQGEGQDLFKRQECDDGVPISTRYEASTITNIYVSTSYYSSPPRSTDPLPETPRPSLVSWTHHTLHTLRTPRPQVSIQSTTSTTRPLPPKKSVVSTSTDIIAKARAIQVVPVTITRTIVTRIPVETIYSCPPPSGEPSTSREPPTSRIGPPTSREPPTSSREPPTTFSREPPTSWVEPTSRSGWPTSWRTNTTDFTEPPSTRHRPTSSSGEPWYPSSTLSVPTSRSRPSTPPSTSPPPSTRPTSTLFPPASSLPNSITTQTPWPPIMTTPHSYSECVYTLFDGTVPYGNYTASCTSSTASESLCTSFHRSGGWDLVPCTSTYPNTTSMTSTLTNTTTSTQIVTSWSCSSYVSSWGTWVPSPCTSSINITSSTWPCSSFAASFDRWVPVPCTSTTHIVTLSPVVRCSSFLGSRSGWVPVPCTSTPNITSTPPTITATPTVTITPTLTRSGSCSTYVEDLRTWFPVPCGTITTIPSVITITITESPTITRTSITQTPTITRRPTASRSQDCSVYVPELELWVSVPCSTARPTRSMCLNDDENMWIPCTSVSRTSDTDVSSQIITETSDTSPIFVTVSQTSYTDTSDTRAHTPSPQTLFPTITSTGAEQSTIANESTQLSQTEAHISTRTQTDSPSSAASFGASNEVTPTPTPTSQASLGSSQEVRPSSTPEVRPSSSRVIGHSSTREMVTAGGTTDIESIQPAPTPRPTPTPTRASQPPSAAVIFTSNFAISSNEGTTFPTPNPTTITTATDGIHGGPLAGIIVGSILGVVGLLGLGAFIMKSFGGPRGRDLYAPRGEYQVASGGGSVGGRDDGEGGGGGGGGGAGGMSEARNEGPLRSALRNRNIADGIGEWRDASWNQPYAYTGVAAAAAVAATAANNQRERDSEASRLYADGGIRDEETPDGLPQRYADSGLSGPDSHYDTGISDHPYGNQDLRYIVSNTEVQFDPYHDLAVRQDSIPVGGNIPRQSAFSSPEIPLGSSGAIPTHQSEPGNVTAGYVVTNLQPVQTDNGTFLSSAAGLSTTGFAPIINDPSLQPQVPGESYPSSPPYAYAGNNVMGSGTYQSPEPVTTTDIQRPPYWENSVPAISVDSLPQHGNIPRYSALTDIGAGGTPAPAYNSAPGIDSTSGTGDMPGMGDPTGTSGTHGLGSALAPAPEVGNTTGVGGTPHVFNAVSPTWNPVGATEFGQNSMSSPSTQVGAATYISGSAAPDAPRGLHQGLTRLSTEVASAEERDIDASSLRSRASVRPPRVGGPRTRPLRNSSGFSASPISPTSRADSRRSLPPAYEERQTDM